MKKKIIETNSSNNIVNYTIEEADAALDAMIQTTLSEFEAACDKIDAEYEKTRKVSRNTITKKTRIR